MDIQPNVSVLCQLNGSTKNQILLFLSADVKWNMNIYYLGCLLFKMTHHPRDHSTDGISHNSSNYWKSPLVIILFDWDIILSDFPFNAPWKSAHTAKEGHSFRNYWAHFSQVSVYVGLEMITPITEHFTTPPLKCWEWLVHSHVCVLIRGGVARRSGCDRAA